MLLPRWYSVIIPPAIIEDATAEGLWSGMLMKQPIPLVGTAHPKHGSGKHCQHIFDLES